MIGRTSIAGVCLLVFFLSFADATSAAMPPDLKLLETTEQKVVLSPRPNPHDRFTCAECHRTAPRKPVEGGEKAAEAVSDDYPDELCVRCHPACSLHPTGLEPRAVRVPDLFPLRRTSGNRVRVVCLSCHDIHFSHTGYHLLRGFPRDRSSQPGRFSSRLEFCRACHGKGIEALSPHRSTSSQAGCSFCHAGKPDASRKEPLRAGPNDLCSFCHPVEPEPHYYRFNPFPDLEPGAPAASGLPAAGGATTCLTCHQAHLEAAARPYLRQAYLDLAKASSRIDPHRRRKVFCEACHTASPPFPGAGKAASRPLRQEDAAALCNRCHGGGRVTGMYHPLVPVGEREPRPAGFPLGPGGTISCLTCHLPGHYAAPSANPAFLRGGPYPGLVQFCSLCHLREALASRNPHREYDLGKGCEYCHEEGDRFAEGSLKVGPASADDTFVCLLCHEYHPHPANTRHTLRPGKYDFVSIDTRAFPLDRFGRITCFTCHQVHQPSSTPLLFRGPVSGRPVCNGCHPF